MPDERRVDSMPPEKLFLEWQDDCSLRNDARELRKTSFSPCPDLGGDVIQDWNTCVFRRGGRLHIETGIVDDYQELHVTAVESLAYRLQQRKMPGDVTNHFEEAHHSALIFVEQLDSRGLHQVAAESGKLEIRTEPLQLFCDARRVEIARGFSSDEKNFRHPELPLRP